MANAAYNVMRLPSFHLSLDLCIKCVYTWLLNISSGPFWLGRSRWRSSNRLFLSLMCLSSSWSTKIEKKGVRLPLYSQWSLPVVTLFAIKAHNTQITSVSAQSPKRHGKENAALFSEAPNFLVHPSLGWFSSKPELRKMHFFFPSGETTIRTRGTRTRIARV